MTRPVDPVQTYHEVARIVRTTDCTNRLDEDGHEQWEPMTYEEAAVLAPAITTYIANHYERKTPA